MPIVKIKVDLPKPEDPSCGGCIFRSEPVDYTRDDGRAHCLLFDDELNEDVRCFMCVFASRHPKKMDEV